MLQLKKYGEYFYFGYNDVKWKRKVNNFLKNFYLEKKLFDDEWKKNVLFFFGFGVKIVDVEFLNDIYYFFDKLICICISYFKL